MPTLRLFRLCQSQLGCSSYVSSGKVPLLRGAWLVDLDYFGAHVARMVGRT